MKITATRAMHSVAISLIALLVVTGVAFASGGSFHLNSAPNQVPASADASGTPGVTTTQGPEATKVPEVDESSEPTKAPKASDADAAEDAAEAAADASADANETKAPGDESGDKDGDGQGQSQGGDHNGNGGGDGGNH